LTGRPDTLDDRPDWSHRQELATMLDDLDLAARAALAAFRTALVAELASVPAPPVSLSPHVVGYRRSRNGSWGSELLRGQCVTGKFTTADFVWGRRARFWVSVGEAVGGGRAINASVTGFGTMEGLWSGVRIPAGDGQLEQTAAEFGQRVAVFLIRDRYTYQHGWN
jgi:hypothetical protein